MNAVFFVGEKALMYAFPQVGAAVTTVRYAQTAYRITKASASIFAGDFLSGGASIASMVVSQLAGTSMGPGIPDSYPAVKYLLCLNKCHTKYQNGHVWDLAHCLADCERYRP